VPTLDDELKKQGIRGDRRSFFLPGFGKCVVYDKTGEDKEEEGLTRPGGSKVAKQRFADKRGFTQKDSYQGRGKGKNRRKS